MCVRAGHVCGETEHRDPEIELGLGRTLKFVSVPLANLALTLFNKGASS